MQTASSGIFPLCFCRQAESLYLGLPIACTEIVHEYRPPCVERFCLAPRHAHHRIVVIGGMVEIMHHVLGIRISRITHPYQRIGVNIDCFFNDELRTITVSADAMQLIQAIYLAELFVQSSFACGSIEIHPPVTEVQFSGVVTRCVVKLIRALEEVFIIQKIENIFVLPINRGFPIQNVPLVDKAIQFPSQGVFCKEEVLVIVFGKGVAEKRILHPTCELAVFVIGDLMHVHVECWNTHGF